ncbi:thioredoxin peroxidase dot5 [Malassezia cuniculi]|uniref:thioredoxin-dependent peroxiredoxin n=1 Tax=Malassezia cuniculi TaxID=948313 RepID=A0AAF0F232_9BASI|nr:thioredoxin peroxidase dot5 [Malassezia cuniculi]
MSTRRTSQRLAERGEQREQREQRDAEPAPAAKKQRTAPKAPAEPSKALAVGDALPELTLLDQHGKEVHLKDVKRAVIFTYPRANTPGCTRQAQCYRDDYAKWTDKDYQVFGLSTDAPSAQLKWAEYTLLSDPKRELIGPLTGTTSSTRRSHFVITDGRLVQVSVGVKPVESSENALTAT